MLAGLFIAVFVFGIFASEVARPWLKETPMGSALAPSRSRPMAVVVATGRMETRSVVCAPEIGALFVGAAAR
jgi:hypothetical protein